MMTPHINAKGSGLELSVLEHGVDGNERWRMEDGRCKRNVRFQKKSPYDCVRKFGKTTERSAAQQALWGH